MIPCGNYACFILVILNVHRDIDLQLIAKNLDKCLVRNYREFKQKTS